MTEPWRTFHEQNRRAWNEATPIHNRYKGDQVAFFRSGGSTLYAMELEDLEDLRGQRVLHLQCNCGQDSLSLARLGAQVTGVDISDEAIAFACHLAKATGLSAEFIRCDVLDFQLDGGQPYDVVYATRGVFCWIGDLRRWMEVAASCLRPGGFLYLMDDHPLAAILNEHLSPVESYFPSTAPEGGVRLDYIGQSGEGQEQKWEWIWPLGEIVTAAVEAGLTVRYLREHPFTYYQRWPQLIERDRLYYLPDGFPAIPLCFTLRADRA